MVGSGLSVDRDIMKSVSEKAFGFGGHTPDFLNPLTMFGMVNARPKASFHQFAEVMDRQGPTRVGQVPKPYFVGVVCLEGEHH